MCEKLKVTILGCGSSWGVPCPWRGWGKCDPQNPKNKRSRSSIFIEKNNTKFIVDTTPEFREQIISAQITDFDAVFYTHDHADHTHGIDDLRGLSSFGSKIIPVYTIAPFMKEIKKRFGYLFVDAKDFIPHYKPFLKEEVIEDNKFTINEISGNWFEQDHGACKSIGIRIGSFAYSTDVLFLSEEVLDSLHNLDLWIVDCVSYYPSHSHAHLDRVLEWVEKIKPKRTILTHMNYSLDYERLRAELPEGIEPAYDGMQLLVVEK